MSRPASPEPRPDLAILGGGLAGALVALTLAARRPELRVTVIEQGETLGGAHVWSFFASDLPDGAEALLEPLIAARWDGYDVHFPGHSRRLATPYRAITAARLDDAVRTALPHGRVLTGARVTAASAGRVSLDDGRTIEAGAVLDTRGAHGLPALAGGWQKFLGQTLRLGRPHGLARPVVMDARVTQYDGYRFLYALPFSPTELFLEDTYYSDSPHLDRPLLRDRIAAYVAGNGWEAGEVTYEEAGVLPVIAAGDFEAFWNAADALPARAGARAALVHPLTSYSLPDAVRFAWHLATLDNFTAERLGTTCHEWAATHWRGGRFYRMLSRMLFGAAEPAQRWRLLERFYRLPEPLIERFYAGRSTAADMARVLVGRPPVPIGAALASLSGGGRPLADLGAPLAGARA